MTQMVRRACAVCLGLVLIVPSAACRAKPASVEELWAWHLEGEALFPVGPPAGDTPPGGPRELYVEVAARWAGHRRRDRTWLLAVEPVEECWRIYWLRGMPLRQQFEQGWTTPFWQ